MIRKANVFALFFLLYLTSCMSDVDFDQLDDAAINPTYRISFVYFNLSTTSFLDDSGIFSPEINDFLIAEAFNNSFNLDYLSQLVFNFEIDNSFPTDMQFTYIALDDQGLELFTFDPIIVPAFSTNYTIDVTHEGGSLENLLAANSFTFKIKLLNPMNVTISEVYDFSLDSTATFYYTITTTTD